MRGRKLVIGELSFAWARRHTHVQTVERPRCCAELVSVWLEGQRGGQLTILFVDGPQGTSTCGEGWGGHDGGLLVGDVAYNLNRPGVIAALTRHALAEGWKPHARKRLRLEGFALLARSGAPRG